MSIILELVFVFSFLVLLIQVHKGLLAFVKVDYTWPFLGKDILAIYPCLLYQIYFWAHYFKIFN
jgi:hypothetical protein